MRTCIFQDLPLQDHGRFYICILSQLCISPYRLHQHPRPTLSKPTHMPLLQQHPDGLRGDERSLPDPQLGPHLAQQVQDGVALLPELQLDPVVLSRHPHAGEPGEDVHDEKDKLQTDTLDFIQ